MLRNCIKEIIEPMGFVNEGDSQNERWVGYFIASRGGEVYTIVVKEILDDSRRVRIMFDVSDEEGDVVDTMTLDQMMVEFENDLEPAPINSTKRFVVTCTVEVEVDVDLRDLSEDDFRYFIKHGCVDEEEIAEKVAENKLNDVRYSDFDVVDVTVNALSEW